MIKALFSSIDGKNIEDFSEFFAVDSVFRFGNQPEVHGKQLIAEYVSAFFASIHSLQHQVLETWQAAADTIICHGVVTYTRHDSKTLTVPFVNVFKLAGSKISKYLIFVDNSELYL